MPGVLYVWLTVGAAAGSLAGSERPRRRSVPPGDEASVKVTVSGAVPLVTVGVKSTVVGAVTVMPIVSRSRPEVFVAVIVTM